MSMLRLKLTYLKFFLVLVMSIFMLVALYTLIESHFKFKTARLDHKTVLINNKETNMELWRQRALEAPVPANDKKLILVYTAWFSMKPWPNIPENSFTGGKCPFDSCEVTYDHQKLKESDLVLFHGCDLPLVPEMRKHRRVNFDHYWLFLLHETPENSFFDENKYNGFFNWTLTYRLDSDIHYPYAAWQTHQDMSSTARNFAQGKSKLITVVNSHCDSARMGLIARLKKYVPVDVYGGCSKLFKENLPKCPLYSKECSAIQHKYKFYLAYENGFCTDYVTEKYWYNALGSGLVPVVIGGANYSDSRIAIPGSYINALDFPSLSKLADYLNYLDKNDTAYNEYHAWRAKYHIIDSSLMCRICKKITTGPFERKEVNMSQFWGWSQNCRNSTLSVQHLN